MCKSNFKKMVSKILLISLFICFNPQIIMAYSQKQTYTSYNELINQLEKIKSISDSYVYKKTPKDLCIKEMLKKHIVLEKKLTSFLEQNNLKDVGELLVYLEKNPQLTLHLLTESNKILLNEYSNSILMSNLEISLKLKKLVNFKNTLFLKTDNRLCTSSCLVAGIYIIATLIIGSVLISDIMEDHGDHTVEYQTHTPLRECGNCNTLGRILCPACDGFECSNCDNTGKIECPSCNGTGFLGI